MSKLGGSVEKVDPLMVGFGNVKTFTDDNLKELAALKNIVRLNITGTKITDDGVKHLVGLDRLEALNLSVVPVTDAGIKHLAALRSLRMLNLYGTDVTEAGVAELQKAIPDCSIMWDGNRKDSLRDKTMREATDAADKK